MKKSRRFTVMFLCLTAASSSFGVAAKSWITYAPTISWMLTIIFLAAACIAYSKESQ